MHETKKIEVRDSKAEGRRQKAESGRKQPKDTDSSRNHIYKHATAYDHPHKQAEGARNTEKTLTQTMVLYIPTVILHYLLTKQVSSRYSPP